MIGLGTQDSGGEAADFVRDYSTWSFPMYWDETFETWAAIGVNSQPAAVLLGADGTPLGGWLGNFPRDEVLELAANS